MATLGSFDSGSNKGLFFSVSVPGAQGFALALSRFGQGLSDFTTFWSGPFKVWWYAIRELDYAAAGSTTGDRWAPLSANYRKWKNRHFPSAPLLVLHGDLKASVISDQAPGSVWRPAPQSLAVGTSIPYAIYHQKGTSRMPARPVIRFAQVDRVNVGKKLQAFVAASWKERRAAAGGEAA